MKKKYFFKAVVFCVTGVLTAPAADAQKVIEPKHNHPEWTRNTEPFRIAGNLYYVGTEDLASYLITTSKGNILINTGLASSFDVIKSNIEQLGFKIGDIKILLTTQAHYDHMGAMAAMKDATGATFMADAGDVDMILDGGASDYALGNGTPTFAPLKVDRVLHDHDKVTLGDMSLELLHHPGHTKGSCSYLFNVSEKDITWRVLIANMPSIVTDKKFSEVAAYPHIAADYAETLKAMKTLQFDIWLASHASQFDLHSKRKPGAAYKPSAFIDQKGYDESMSGLQAAYDEKVAGER